MNDDRSTISALVSQARWDDVAAVLCDIQSLQGACRSSVFTLIDDFRVALSQFPTTHKQYWQLARLSDGLQRDASFVQRHPTALFQSLWNACWWCDASEAKCHYLLRTGPGNVALPWDMEIPKVSHLLQEWRLQRRTSQKHHTWVRALLPPSLFIGSQEVVFSGHLDRVYCVAFAPSGDFCVSGSEDKSVRVWDSRTGEELCALTFAFPVQQIEISSDGAFVAVGTTRNIRGVWRINDSTELIAVRDPEPYVTHVLFSTCRIASLAIDKVVRLCDYTGARVGYDIRCFDGIPVSIPNGKGLRERGADVTALEVCADEMAFAPDGTLFLKEGPYVWNAETGEDVTEQLWTSTLQFVGGTAACSRRNSLLWSEDDEPCNGISILDEHGEALAVVYGHDGRVTDAAVSPDRRSLATSSLDGTVRVTPVVRSQPARPPELVAPHYRIEASAFAPDGTTLVFCNGGDEWMAWPLMTASKPKVHRIPSMSVSRCEFSSDGKLLALGGSDGRVAIWNIHSMRVEREFAENGAGVRSLAFSSDSRLLVCGHWDGKIDLWDVGDWGKVKSIDARPLDSLGGGPVLESIAVHSESELIACGLTNGAIWVWPRLGAGVPCILRGHHEGAVTKVALSEDASMLASASDDLTARLWNMQTGRLEKVFDGTSDPRVLVASTNLSCCAFARQEQVVVVESNTGEELAWFPARVRSLTASANARFWAGEDYDYRGYIFAIEDVEDDWRPVHVHSTGPITVDTRRNNNDKTARASLATVRDGMLRPNPAISEKEKKERGRGLSWIKDDYVVHEAICPVCGAGFKAQSQAYRVSLRVRFSGGPAHSLDRPITSMRIKCGEPIGESLCTVGTGDSSGFSLIPLDYRSHPTWTRETVERYLDAIGSPFASHQSLQTILARGPLFEDWE